MHFRVVSILIFLVVMTGIAMGAPMTQSFSYQGTLTDSSGIPLNDTLTMTFNLYDVESGGVPLTGPDAHTVTVTKGLFTTSVTFNASFFDGRALWLGIRVGDDPEMIPRHEIQPVPVAMSLWPDPFGAIWNAITNLIARIAVLEAQVERSVIPLVQAGTPFNSGAYPQNTPQSVPMVFMCNWSGIGQVWISGDEYSLTPIRADDGYTITIQPSGATFNSIGTSAGFHPPLELTSGMRPGVNTFTLIVQNWQGLSMSYGSFNGDTIDQIPHIVQVMQ